MLQKNQLGQIMGVAVENFTPRALPTCPIMKGNYCTLETLNISKHGAALFDAFTTNTQGERTYLPFGPFTIQYDD